MSSITRLVGTACVANFTLSNISHAVSTPSAATAAGDDAMQRMQEQLLMNSSVPTSHRRKRSMR